MRCFLFFIRRRGMRMFFFGERYVLSKRFYILFETKLYVFLLVYKIFKKVRNDCF